MRYWLALVVVVMISGCSGLLQPKVSSAGKRVNRTYRMVSCRATFDSQLEQGVPCTSYVAGLYYVMTDSARLTLRDDGTAFWMRADRLCTGQPCSATPQPQGISSSSGTYRFGSDSVLAHLALTTASGYQDLAFSGSVPDMVSSDWAGPDVLTFNLSNGAYLGVFKP